MSKRGIVGEPHPQWLGCARDCFGPEGCRLPRSSSRRRSVASRPSQRRVHSRCTVNGRQLVLSLFRKIGYQPPASGNGQAVRLTATRWSSSARGNSPSCQLDMTRTTSEKNKFAHHRTRHSSLEVFLDASCTRASSRCEGGPFQSRAVTGGRKRNNAPRRSHTSHHLSYRTKWMTRASVRGSIISRLEFVTGRSDLRRKDAEAHTDLRVQALVQCRIHAVREIGVR